mgnify:CR=1 FL=1
MVLYSKTRYVVSFLGLEKEAQLDGRVVILGDKKYEVRPLEPREVIVASLFWLFLLALVFYFYPFSHIVSLSFDRLGIFLIAMAASFLTFYKKIPYILGIGIIVVAVLRLSFVYDWVGGLIAGFASYLIYTISTRGLIRKDGVIIMPPL